MRGRCTRQWWATLFTTFPAIIFASSFAPVGRAISVSSTISAVYATTIITPSFSSSISIAVPVPVAIASPYTPPAASSTALTGSAGGLAIRWR